VGVRGEVNCPWPAGENVNIQTPAANLVSHRFGRYIMANASNRKRVVELALEKVLDFLMGRVVDGAWQSKWRRGLECMDSVLAKKSRRLDLWYRGC
jgi:hypothetical protein